MPPFADDDMLMLSGIQHYMFCPRQWALIHIEQQWGENRLTAEGRILHENVDNPCYRQKNGNTLTLRSMHVASKQLGLYGITDAVELIPATSCDNAITHPKYKGLWCLYPVEYKRGRSKPDERDEVQLAAQVICLEEMYGIQIPSAALYYGEMRHREIVSISDRLRNLTIRCAMEMHQIFETGRVPQPDKQKHCRNCSLKDICLPDLQDLSTVKHYLKKHLYEEAP